MDSLFVSLTNGIDVITRFSDRARTPIYKTMTLARIVTEVVNFKMSKKFRSELAIFGRGGGATSSIDLLFFEETLIIDPPCLTILVRYNVDPGLFYRKIEKLEKADVFFCSIISHTSFIVFFLKKYRWCRYTGL